MMLLVYCQACTDGADLSAASHDANHGREGSSSGRRGILVREKSRIEDAVLTRDRG